MALSVVLLCVSLLLTVYLGFKFLYVPLQLFRNNGIKGPRPLPLLGNFLLRRKLGYFKFHEHLNKKYGPIYGFYYCHMPFVTVMDVDMMKQIFVKDFEAFSDRPYIPDLTREASAPKGLLTSQGMEWKIARQTLSPSFSAAKMKAMVPLIEKSAETLVDVMGQSANSAESVDVYKIYGHFTMETILATAFGRSINVQRGESNQIVEAASLMFQSTEEGNSFSIAILLPLIYTIPCLETLIRYMFSQNKVVKYSQLMYSLAKELVKQRRQNPNHSGYKDLLQLMIDANSSEDSGEDSGQHLTDDQIVAHSVTFLLAGYETTSTTLAYVSYMLALHPEVQDRLQKEIDSYFEGNSDSSLYDAAQEIEYLERVIYETLRFYSPAGSLLRYCQKSVVINGIKISKGVTLDFPIHLVHKDPKHWSNPDVFNPERFSPEEKAKRPALSFIPFGYGPRNVLE